AFLCVMVSAAANRSFKDRVLREGCGALSWGSWPELDEFPALFTTDIVRGEVDALLSRHE
ncbi:MAG: hypothetical protein RR753_05970, partial [Raoultibacter sp.]